MSELVAIDHVSITAEGPTLSLGIDPGQWVGIYGPASSGKSVLLRQIEGAERPAQGTITRHAEPAVPYSNSDIKRSRPRVLARYGKGQNSSALATELLLATRLWDDRNKLTSELSSSQVAAAKLLGALASDSKLILLDGHLDSLDPWTLRSVIDYLRRLRSRGVALVAVTNRLELGTEFDALVVMSKGNIRFAGSPAELIRKTESHEFTVSAKDHTGVRALVSPFSVSVQQVGEDLCIRAAEGQEIAARLLLEGYGNVQHLLYRAPTVPEALLNLIR